MLAQLFQDLPQAAAPDHLHGEEQPLLGVDAEFMDRHDIGMFQLAGDLRLFDEAGLLAFVAVVEHVLDGHFAADVAVDGPHHRPHAAAGDLPFDRVAAAMAGVPGEQIGHGPLLAVRTAGQVERDVHVEPRLLQAAGRAVDLARGRRRCVGARPRNGQWLLAGGTTAHRPANSSLTRNFEPQWEQVSGIMEPLAETIEFRRDDPPIDEP